MNTNDELDELLDWMDAFRARAASWSAEERNVWDALCAREQKRFADYEREQKRREVQRELDRLAGEERAVAAATARQRASLESRLAQI